MLVSNFGKISSLLFAKRISTVDGYYKQKSNNDHFHPFFDIIVFKMKRSSFPVV